MIRRDPIETKINHERWLVSYADFITLLFAFFVVMYSVSQVNEAKYKQLANTLTLTFAGAQTNTTGNEQTEQLYNAPEQSLGELSDVQQQLDTTLQGLVQQSRVSLSGNEDWVEIDINASLIFDSGEAELSKEAQQIFNQIADVLAPYENAVEVSGHTDDVPISNAEFANNWELSSARAVAVVNWLAYNGIKPERLAAVGYGEYRPVADNATAEGKAANRRVVLRVARERAEQPKQQVQNVLTGAEVLIEQQTPPQGETEQLPSENTSIEDTPKIEPIKLENGGLLFTNDPDTPRNR